MVSNKPNLLPNQLIYVVVYICLMENIYTYIYIFDTS